MRRSLPVPMDALSRVPSDARASPIKDWWVDRRTKNLLDARDTPVSAQDSAVYPIPFLHQRRTQNYRSHE